MYWLFIHFAMALTRTIAIAAATAVLALPLLGATTSIGTTQVSATVLGTKPVVVTLSPTSGANNVATPLTQIVGQNFGANAAAIVAVTLDDVSGTVLTGTAALQSGCDADGTNCGGSGTYQRITGLSVPSGVAAGTYNVLVTTAQGTNLVSSQKFTSTVPVASPVPSVFSPSPSAVFLIEGVPDSFSLSVSVQDGDSDSVNMTSSSNVTGVSATPGVTPTALTGLSSATNNTKRFTYSVSANGSSPAGSGRLTLTANDGVNQGSRNIDIVVTPDW